MLVSLLSVGCGLLYQAIFGLNLLALVVPVALVIMALGVLFPLCLGQALAPFTHLAGIANALVFSACWLCTAVVSFLASGLSSISAIPLLLMYAILLTTVALIFRFKR